MLVGRVAPAWLLATVGIAVSAGGLVHCGSSVTAQGGGGAGAGTTGSTDTTAPGGGGAALTLPCGSDACGAGELCDYNYHYCSNAAPQSGCDPIWSECVSKPPSCTDGGPAVCGCDRQVYDTQCHAAAAGVDIGAQGCASNAGPTGTFGCGPFFCDASVSYCYREIGDSCDRWFHCWSLPAACQTLPQADCSCFDVGPLEDCQMIPGNGVSGVQIDGTPF